MSKHALGQPLPHPSGTGRTVALWGPVVVTMVAIFAFSAMPAGSTDHGPLVTVLRKCAHVGEYALLCTLLWRALRPRLGTGAALAAAVAIAIAYAATDEFHQTFVDGRVGSWRDVALFDAPGALAAAAAIGLLTRRASPKRRAPPGDFEQL